MKLSPLHQIWRMLTKEPGRYRLDAAKLEIENGKGKLIATNGRALVVLPVELSEGDEPGLIPRSALCPESMDGEEDEDGVWFPSDPRELRVNGEGVSLRHERPKGEFPSWPAVVPAADAPVASDVWLSAQLLYDMACAMGALDRGLRLRIPAPEGGVVRGSIRVEGPDGAVGAIMPMLKES